MPQLELTEDMTLDRRVLEVEDYDISHKGEDMANGIGRCLREWGINKIFTVTVDNASSNDVIVKELSKQLTKMGTNLMNGNHLHVRCMAHIMNLVVQDSLKESSVSIERVRHAVRYVRQSPARLKRFQECFDDEQLNYKKTLCWDVPTRWNSTYLILRRAVEFESTFSHYASSEIGLRHYLEHSYIEVVIPTANEDTVLSEMAKKMKEKFNKYWGDPGKMNKIIFISCILDPRYKLESVSYALVKMFGEDPGQLYKQKLSDSQVSTQNTGFLESVMQDIKKYKSGSGGVDTKTELDKYFGEETEDDTKEFDVLLW
ncbi:zinc finger BED domain-containing protein RICESLEEPER 2-like [Nicotiana tomentosiformis]|uniref:zinc finger BED domain-containing protein RICESLEEPER 2-like n=1 Tax=Nicotiana tomentosiformis TaxID=4098 RepID=UPI00388C92C4